MPAVERETQTKSIAVRVQAPGAICAFARVAACGESLPSFAVQRLAPEQIAVRRVWRFSAASRG
jgi:hypothetical protein